MRNNKQLIVNFDEIQKAMEDISRDTFDYFFDTETGEVVAFSEEIMRDLASRLYDNDFEEIEEDIEYIEFDEEPDLPEWMFDEMDIALELLLNREERYIRIPERKSSIAYQAMADFIETVENSMLRDELRRALNGKGAFRKFKDALLDYPKERKRWYGHNAKAIKREIREWLHRIGVKPTS